MKRLLLVIGIPIVIGATLSFARSATRAAGTATDVVIPAPRDWVAFDADFERVMPAKPRVVGRYQRASDGSTREETWVEGAQTTVVAIMNVGQRSYYESWPNGKWCVHPMRPRESGHRPLLRRVETRGLSPVDEKIEGLSLYRYVVGDGRFVQLQAPALNFFSLIITDTGVGTFQRYYNVKMRDQHGAAFVPPQQASVEVHADLRGIVAHKTGEPRIDVQELNRRHRQPQ